MENEQLLCHEKHPLTLCEPNSINKHHPSGEPVCYGCRKQITSPDPFYTCSDCNICLHRQCTRLPKQISHSRHPEHALIFRSEPPNNATFACDVCKEKILGSAYACSLCDFDVDISCAFDDKSMLDHPAHNHPLTLMHRRASFVCDACGASDDDQSYLCTTCLFWVHKSCALLPATVDFKHHNHQLLLSSCLPLEFRSFNYACDVCNDVLYRSTWVFYCRLCRYFVHLKCLTGAPKHIQFDEPSEEEKEDTAKKNLLHLPTVNVFQPNALPVGEQCSRDVSTSDEMEHFSHEHKLTFCSKEDDNDLKGEIICDGCSEPIASTFYKCSDCKFFLHQTCAQLPTELTHPLHQHPLYLDHFTTASYLFKCVACHLYSNGFFFTCKTCDDFHLDVKCAFLPKTIIHESHKHPLTRMGAWDRMGCWACGHIIHGISYGCEPCDFHISYSCALLPKTAKHRWDKHPLILRFPPFSDHPDEFYCEICEDELHPKRWLYHCQDCDQSFHPACLPTLGLYRNFKFGHSVEVGNHSHSLTFIRDTKFNTSCNSCTFSFDCGPSFECASCNFHLCRICVINNS